jgi:cysteine desulfurase
LKNFMSVLPVYLDYNSTTPVDPEVLEVMLPYFSEKFGNASSNTHSYGWIADEAVKIARAQLARFLNCTDSEIVFTSGATEAANLALKGVYDAYKTKGNHIVTVKTEHKAVLDVCSELEKKGAEITYLDVDREGIISLEQLEDSVTEKTILVAVMYANNETGVIQPVKEIAEIVHAKKSIFFCDATQAAGKTSLDVMAEGIDLLAFSAHKMYGPKGTGALYVRRRNPRVSLVPLIHGGGHEKGLRSGTLNVPAIAGFGKACEIAANNHEERERIENLRNELEYELLKLPGAELNGHTSSRLNNTISIRFKGQKAAGLIMKGRELAFAAGSACTSALPAPSHVLTAMGLSPEECFETIRLSIGRNTNVQEISEVIEFFKKIITKS